MLDDGEDHAGEPGVNAVLGQIFRFEEEEGPNEDDLNLILAAPDLILALRDAVAALGGITSDNVPQTIRAAIAKATGSAA